MQSLNGRIFFCSAQWSVIPISGKNSRHRQLHFFVSEQEEQQIRQRMEQAGIRNLSAYLRKMAVDGYVIQLDLSDVGQMVSLLRRCSNNINQLARRANAGGNIYAEDIEDMRRQYGELWGLANGILKGLAEIPV